MKTDDLIDRLARDSAAAPLRTGPVAAAVLGIVLLSVSVFLAVIGLRPGLTTVLMSPVLAAKTLVPAVLCLATLPVVLRLMRPESNAPVWYRGLLLTTAGAAAALCATGFATQAPGLWFADVSPVAVAECLGFIILISCPALGFSLALLRRGASTAPARSGALLGLAISAGAAAGYSLYCTQDNPVFFVIWYGLAILVMTALGGIAGARLLRW